MSIPHWRGRGNQLQTSRYRGIDLTVIHHNNLTACSPILRCLGWRWGRCCELRLTSVHCRPFKAAQNATTVNTPFLRALPQRYTPEHHLPPPSKTHRSLALLTPGYSTWPSTPLSMNVGSTCPPPVRHTVLYLSRAAALPRVQQVLI